LSIGGYGFAGLGLRYARCNLVVLEIDVVGANVQFLRGSERSRTRRTTRPDQRATFGDTAGVERRYVEVAKSDGPMKILLQRLNHRSRENGHASQQNQADHEQASSESPSITGHSGGLGSGRLAELSGFSNRYVTWDIALKSQPRPRRVSRRWTVLSFGTLRAACRFPDQIPEPYGAGLSLTANLRLKPGSVLDLMHQPAHHSHQMNAGYFSFFLLK